MPPTRPHEVAFAIRGPISRADLRGLCERVCARLDAGDALLTCDVAGVEPDAVTVDALARLQLGARRRDCRVRLRGTSPGLLDLVELMGLTHVIIDTVEFPDRQEVQPSRDDRLHARQPPRRR
jgi:ABC-type transporter Mla MlaB component